MKEKVKKREIHAIGHPSLDVPTVIERKVFFSTLLSIVIECYK